MEADREIAEGIQQGKALIAAGRLAEAERAYLDLLTGHPQAGRAHFHLGQIYMRQRRWADAVPALRAALALQPENTKIRASLERAVLKHGQPAEQEALVESEVAAVDEIAKSGAFEPAILRYRDIANRYPESALVWRQLARVQAELQRWPAAVESAQKGSRHRPHQHVCAIGAGARIDTRRPLARSVKRA